MRQVSVSDGIARVFRVISRSRVFWRARPAGDLPQVERKLAINCTGMSLDLMESELDKGGAKYAVLQEFPVR